MTKNLRTVVPSLLLSMTALGACAADDPRTTAPDAGFEPDTGTEPDAAMAARPIVSTSTIELAESSETTFTVTLSGPPSTSPSTLILNPSDRARLRLQPWALTFTDADWQRPQVVTLAALGDDDADDDALQLTVAGDAGAAPAQVAVAVDDDDTLGIEVLDSPTPRLEEGAAATIEVRLTARPAAPVLVEGGSDDSRIAVLSPATLTFTPDDWAIPQRARVVGVEDANTTDDHTKLRWKATGVESAAIEVEVVERVEVAISPSTIDLGAIFEGNESWFFVVLTAPPAGELVVEVTSSMPEVAAVAPAALTFSPTRWDVPQRVTVSALHDSDSLDHGLSVGLSAAGLELRKVAVEVLDDDVRATP